MFLDIILAIYYLAHGIIPYKKYEKFEIHLFAGLLIYNIILNFGFLFAFAQATNIIHQTQLIAWLCVTVGGFFFKIIAYVHKKELFALASKMSENSLFGKTDILEKVRVKLMNKFSLFMVIVFASLSAELNVTYLHFFTKSEIDYDDPDLYVMPYFCKFWRVNSLKEYFFTFWLQMIVCSPEFVGNVMPLFFLCCYVVSLEVHLEEIRTYAKDTIPFVYKIVPSLDGNKKLEDSSEALDVLRKRLQNLVKFQQYIHRFLNDFISCGEWMLNALMVFFFCTLILFTFIGASHTQVNRDVVSTLRTCCVCVYLVYVFYIPCYTGEVVCEINEFLLLSFYDISWYKIPPPMREYVVTPMIQSQHVKSLKVFNMHVINLNFYYRTMRNVYAVVNALILMRRKNIDLT